MTDDTAKDAIESMRRAQANMKAVLDRNWELERQLAILVELADRLIKHHVSSEALIKPHNREAISARLHYSQQVDDVRKHLS